VPSLPLPGLGGVDLLDILNVGVLNEYAKANGDGSSFAASGAVTNSGGFNGTTPNSNATINLNRLLGGVTDTVANLDVQVGALAASATETAGGVQSGDYKIADLKINLQAPLLGTILTTLNNTLGTVNTTLSTLPAVGALAVPGVSLTNLPNLTTLLSNFNSNLNSGADGISIDPTDGSIAISLAALIPNLNDLPANTDLLPYILDALDGLVSGALNTLTTGVTNELSGAIGSSLLGLPLVPLAQTALDLALSTAITPLVTTATGALTDAGTGQASLLDTGTGGLIGGILNGVLDLVANVQQTAGGIFTERALSVGLSLPVGLGGITAAADAVADGGLALINLANANVGPNAGPAVTALAPPVITVPKDGDQTTDTTPQIKGTGVAGAKVTVKEGSKTICTATVAADKTWKCTSVKLALGKHTIVATQTLAGVTSAKSNVVDFTIVAADYNDSGTALPATGGNGSTPLVAAAGLGLLLGGMGLTALPGGVARHGGAGSSGGGTRARGGRHAKR
jgi:hypothetical protein